MAPLTCPNCLHRNVFASREALEHHLLAGHYSCLPYKCEDCQGLERFTTSAKLEQHLTKDHGKTQYQISFAPTDEERFKLEQVSRALLACVKPEIAAHLRHQPAARKRPAASSVRVFKTSSSRDTSPSITTARVGVKARRPASAAKRTPKKRVPKRAVGEGTTGQKSEAVAVHRPLTRQTDSIGRRQVVPRECAQCKETVKGKKLSLCQHINSKHLHIPLRTCTLCGRMFDSYSGLAIRGHLFAKHTMRFDPVTAPHIHTDQEAVAQVEGAMEKFFPTIS